MNDLERRRFDMLARVRDFGAENAADFPAGSVGALAFAVVGSVVDQLEESGLQQVSGINASRQGTALRSVARENLRDDLRAISRTARALSIDDPGLNEKFRMPRGDNDQQMIAAARAFLKDAEPLENRFVAYGLPADFLEDLQDDIEAFEEAVGGQNTAIDGHVGATASIDHQIEQGINAVRKLAAIAANKYRDNPPKLAAWTSASHVEKAPKQKVITEPTA